MLTTNLSQEKTLFVRMTIIFKLFLGLIIGQSINWVISTGETKPQLVINLSKFTVLKKLLLFGKNWFAYLAKLAVGHIWSHTWSHLYFY